MGLSDPFSTTYEGSFKAGQSLGQGIDSAAGSVADVMKQKQKLAQDTQQRSQAFGMLKNMGLIQEDTTPPSLDDLKTGLKVAGKTMGKDISFAGHDDMDEDTQRNWLGSLYKSFNIPIPQGKTKTTVSPGVNMDLGGGVEYKSPVKSLVGELSAMKEKDKKENATAIADAIENGDQLADFQSLYGLAGPVKAELEKRGVNVNKMQLDTIAEKKLAQTLNGPQQTRLRQSIQSVTDGLDVLDNLNQEFKRSGIKAFNKGEIEALANGSGTKEQQELAQRFVTQITGLQDEFGNVIMSGNAPTDKALELAGRIFKSDYNDTSLSASIKQAKQLLSIRRAAIENVGAVGVRGQIENQSGNPAKQTLNATPGMGGQSQSNNNDPLGLR